MPALTLWLKTSLSLSFFERLKGGVVWSFCLNKCLNSFSHLLTFFFSEGEGEMFVYDQMDSRHCLFFVFVFFS